MISLIKIILLLTIFLNPLIGPIRGLGYEQSKVFFFIISLTICVLLWTIYSIKYPVRIVWSAINITALTFTVILFLTSFSGVDPFNSFIGTQPYFQGWVLHAYLFLFFVLVSWLRINLRIWAYILVGSSTLVGILSIYQWVQVNLMDQLLPTYAGRVVSTFGQPNFYAGFILLTLPFFYYLLVKTRKRLFFWFFALILLLSVTSIIISQSKTAILLIIFLALISLVTRIKKLSLLILSVSFVVVIVSVILSNYFSSGILWGYVFGLNLSDNPNLLRESVEKRPYIWQVGFDNFLTRPMVGYGLENIDKVYSNYFKQNKHALFEENLKVSPVLISLKDLNIDRTHNYILDLLLFSGVLGLISWLFLIFFAVRKSLKSKINLESAILLTGFLVYLIWIQFQNPSIVHLVYFWFLVGVIDKEGNTYHT